MSRTMKAVLFGALIIAVAVIVCVALTLTGIMGSNETPNEEVNAETSGIQVARNLSSDAEFVISSSGKITDQNYGEYVVISYEGTPVALSVRAYSNGTYGISAKNGFVPGNAYSITLKRDAEFVAEQYKGLSYLVFTIVKEDSEIMTISDKAILLADWSIASIADDQEVIKDKEGVKVADIEIVNGAEYKYIISFVSAITYGQEDVLVIGTAANGRSFTVVAVVDNTVYADDATIEEVFSEVNISKKLTLEELNAEIYEEETINSILNSEFVNMAGELLFGKDWDLDKDKNINLKLDFSINEDNIGVDLILTFKNLFGDGIGSIQLAVKNVIVLDPYVNISVNPVQFEFSSNLNLQTKATLSFTVGKTWSDTKSFTELVNSLKNLANKDIDDGATFIKFNIPVGTLPICITYEMGFEVYFGFIGTVGVEATNEFTSDFGVVYVDKNFSGFGNYDNDFALTALTVSGVSEARVGITNAIGISAYGVIGVDIDVAVGPYFDLGGKFSINAKNIFDGEFTTSTAYYTEAGIYLKLDLEGTIIGKKIAKKTLLTKKWDLWTAGYRYAPDSFVEKTFIDENDNKVTTADKEIIYVSGADAYIVGFDTMSYDLKYSGLMYGGSSELGNTFNKGEVTLPYDQFNYELQGNASDYITLDGNKISVKPSVNGAFVAYIKVTSKTNNGLSKTLVVKKMPECATAVSDTVTYDVNNSEDVKFDIQLNTSKFVKLSSKKAINEAQYTFADDVLTIKESYLKGLAAGKTQSVVFESSKGNLELYIKCISSKKIEVVGADEVTFDKVNPIAPEFMIETYGSAVKAVALGDEVLPSSAYSFQKNSGTLILYAGYLNGIAAGEYNIKVLADNDTDATATLVIADGRAADMPITYYNYNKNSNASLKLAINFYGDKFANVSCDNTSLKADEYSAKDGIVLSAKFLKQLTPIEHAFVLTTANGARINFTVKVTDAASAIIFTETAKSYDKAVGGEVAFSYIKVGTASVESNDAYQVDVSNSKVIVKASYLKNLAIGENNLTVNGQELVIAVSNSTVPTLNAKSAEFDKASPVDVKVALDLQEASFEGIDGLQAGDYTFANGEVVIAAGALLDCEYGINTFVINTSVNAFSFDVKVVDSRAIEVVDSGIVYNLANKDFEDLTISVKLYDAEFASISGEGIRGVSYRYNDGVITFSSEYVFGLALGAHQYTINTNEGTLNLAFNIEGVVDSYDTVGYGTVAKPYLIFNEKQYASLATASANDNFAGVSFKLGCDLNFAKDSTTPVIGSESKPFAGIFNGDGYTINKVAIQAIADDYTGMFAYIASTGVVKNLKIAEATVDFSDNGAVGAGVIAGNNAGTIANVTITKATINATSKSWMSNTYFTIGGIVGYNTGSIDKADLAITINAEIKGKSVVGIELSHYVFKKSYINVGAVVGYVADGRVDNVTARGTINASAPTNTIAKNGIYGEKDTNAYVNGIYTGIVE